MSGWLMRKRVLLSVLSALVLLAVTAVVVYGWLDYRRFAQTPLTVTAAGQSIDVARGETLRDVVGELRTRHFSHAREWYWRVLAGQLRVAGRMHAGEYALPAGITPGVLLRNMAIGRVMQRDVTLVDGWNFAQVRQALAKADKLSHDTAGLDDATIMQRLGMPGQNPEGWFLPETYAYVKGDTDLDVLRRAHQAMVKTLDALWAGRAKDLPLATPYDALILASIVQKETARADERARVAGVFVRRLQTHMLLQTDPSVIYGMGASYTGTIHKADLLADTPYNTYLHPGLPPTPIAMPGKPAIEAALHPQVGDALYFVARGDGTHAFAATLEQQNRNVACYQLKHCDHD